MADNPNFYQYDNECERAVLGTLLSERDAIHQVKDIISLESFFCAKNRVLYQAILNVVEKGDRADIITIKSELKKTGSDITPLELVEIANCTTFEIVQYACRLSDLEKSRRLYNLGNSLTAKTSTGEDVSDIIDFAKNTLDGIYGDINNHTKTAKDFLQEVYDRVNDNLAGVSVQGTPTGFSFIDNKGGLQPTDLIIIAAASSQGKTSLANAITLHAAKAEHPIAFYSMEMSGRQLMTRFAAMESGISSLRLSNEKLTDNEYRTFNQAIGKLENLPIFFDDRSNSSVEAIISSIRSMVIKKGIKGAVIDYLQLIVRGSKTMNEEAALADAARKLKNLAKELNIWIIALSQLNRDNLNPVPTVDRLRGSGQVNEAADMTILLYRAEIYGKRYPEPFDSTDPKGTALVDIAKGRNVGIGKFIAGFRAEITQFYELNQRPILPFTPRSEEPF